MYFKNYTVIIPHKNIPDLLQRCLDSIPRREDIQIIVVDDNSDPEKVDFETFPGLLDPYVEVVFTNEGKGAGYARNVGLRKAVGKWLLFADADDFYNEGAFDCFDEYQCSGCDAIYWKVDSVCSDTLMHVDRSDYINKLIDNYFVDSDEDNIRYRIIEPWTKMVKADLVEKNGIRFDEVLAGNDVMFSIKIGYLADEIFIDNRMLYCVTVRHGSLVNTTTSIIVRSRMNVKLEQDRYLIKIEKKNMRPIARKYLLHSIHCSFGLFVWCLCFMIKNRMIIFDGVGFKQLKTFLFGLNKRRLKDSAYRKYN